MGKALGGADISPAQIEGDRQERISALAQLPEALRGKDVRRLAVLVDAAIFGFAAVGEYGLADDLDLPGDRHFAAIVAATQRKVVNGIKLAKSIISVPSRAC